MDNSITGKTHIAAPPGRIFWNYSIPPDKGAKVQLLTIGGIQVSGRWYGDWGDAFLAWAPNIKRNKVLERLLLDAKSKGIEPQWEAPVDEQLPEVREVWRAVNALRLELPESIVADISQRIEKAFTALSGKNSGTE